MSENTNFLTMFPEVIKTTIIDYCRLNDIITWKFPIPEAAWKNRTIQEYGNSMFDIESKANHHSWFNFCCYIICCPF